jgi:3-methyladenine DNA glycosylase AlkD
MYSSTFARGGSDWIPIAPRRLTSPRPEYSAEVAGAHILVERRISRLYTQRAMAHPLARAIRTALRAHADPIKAVGMQTYMKSAMPYYGVSAPMQRRVWRNVFAGYRLDCDELRAVALEIWRSAKYREERYAAVALTDQRSHANCQTMAAIPLYEEMIVTGAWWDVVDALATHHLGGVLRNEPRPMKLLMRRWAKDGHLWKRRASILCQIRFKKDTDRRLLYACIEPNLRDRDFFIRKAIGWALRQYAWTDPREVTRYVAINRDRLSPLSVREALKNVQVLINQNSADPGRVGRKARP